jgi:hypothetical protein
MWFLKIAAAHFHVEPGSVRLMSAADWRTARSLVKADLGTIEQGAGEQARFVTNAAGAVLAYPERYEV